MLQYRRNLVGSPLAGFEHYTISAGRPVLGVPGKCEEISRRIGFKLASPNFPGPVFLPKDFRFHGGSGGRVTMGGRRHGLRVELAAERCLPRRRHGPIIGLGTAGGATSSRGPIFRRGTRGHRAPHGSHRTGLRTDGREFGISLTDRSLFRPGPSESSRAYLRLSSCVDFKFAAARDRWSRRRAASVAAPWAMALTRRSDALST